MKQGFAVLLTLACFANAIFSETVKVPGQANPWLAGMTNGSVARRGDSAPDESPVPVIATAVEGGATYEFSASGLVNHGSTLPLFSPDGEDLISHYLGAENGIADITAPFVSLIGAFLDSSPPDRSPAPRPLDFRNTVDRDYQVLAPALKQPFFIGDGSTSSGAVQQVIAPAGATRLFLGVMDQYQWSDNEGAFEVQITKATSTTALRLSLRPSSNPAADPTANPANAATAVTSAPTASPTGIGPELHAFTAIELVWPSEANHLYQVLWTPSLDLPQWISVGPIIAGTGGDQSVFDSTRAHSQGFYRVQVLP